MKIWIKNIALTLMVATFPMVTFSEGVSEAKNQTEITMSNVVLYDEILIDRTIQEVWPELLDFVTWYFKGQYIERIKGQKNQVGNTLLVNNTLRHEIVNIRPLTSIVWKTCLDASCKKDIVFSDFEIQNIDGQTKLTRRIYSQGFWPKDTAKQMLKEASRGKTPDSVRRVSLAFKAYIEK